MGGRGADGRQVMSAAEVGEIAARLELDDCGGCGATLGPSSEFPWHWPDEDCRGVREPLEVFDNGGRTFDRYFAVLPDGSALAVGPTGNAPNGVCMSVSPEEYVLGEHLGRRVSLGEIAEDPVRREIVAYAFEARLWERGEHWAQVAAREGEV